ncbi:hypothetical protein HN011_001486 [Eciton burchellii]|nr:hypothetical protein HN011_001486 [Eciton burchellii]
MYERVETTRIARAQPSCNLTLLGVPMQCVRRAGGDVSVADDTINRDKEESPAISVLRRAAAVMPTCSWAELSGLNTLYPRARSARRESPWFRPYLRNPLAVYGTGYSPKINRSDRRSDEYKHTSQKAYNYNTWDSSARIGRYA